MNKRNVILNKFSENLRKIREEKKMSQLEVSTKIGISRSLYQYYESNKPPDIRLTNLVKILDFFDVSLDVIKVINKFSLSNNSHSFSSTFLDLAFYKIF